MSYKKVAVVGAGAMGTVIAQVLAAASIDVLLIDISTELVESGLKRFPIPQLVQKLNDAGRLGQKTKKGFFEYA